MSCGSVEEAEGVRRGSPTQEPGFPGVGGSSGLLQKLGDHERGPPRPCIGGHTCAAIGFRHSEECDVGMSPEESSVHERLVMSSG